MSQVVDIHNVTAIQNPSQGDYLGYLTWYSIPGQLIPENELRQKLQNAGLAESYMPNPINGSDAFRKASSSAESKIPLDNGSHRNILIREVFSNRNKIQRNVVFETVIPKDKKLGYKTEEAVIEYDKKAKTINVIDCSMEAQDVVNQMKANYQLYLSNYDSRAIRSMAAGILWKMSPVPVRVSGGVYFVPKMYEQELGKLTSFINSLDGEAQKIPLVDSTEQRDMVKGKIQAMLNETLCSLSVVLTNTNMDSMSVTNHLTSAKQVLQNFRDYKKTLNEELEGMTGTLELIQLQMNNMVERLVVKKQKKAAEVV